MAKTRPLGVKTGDESAILLIGSSLSMAPRSRQSFNSRAEAVLAELASSSSLPRSIASRQSKFLQKLPQFLSLPSGDKNTYLFHTNFHPYLLSFLTSRVQRATRTEEQLRSLTVGLSFEGLSVGWEHLCIGQCELDPDISEGSSPSRHNLHRET